MTEKFDDEVLEALEEEYEPVVTLSMEDGSDVDCEVVAVYPCGEKDYIALLPVTGEDAGSNTVYIFRFSESEEGDPILENIEDEVEYEAAIDEFDRFMEADEELEEYDDEIED